MKKTENQALRFPFKSIDREHRFLVHRWLKEPHPPLATREALANAICHRD